MTFVDRAAGRHARRRIVYTPFARFAGLVAGLTPSLAAAADPEPALSSQTDGGFIASAATGSVAVAQNGMAYWELGVGALVLLASIAGLYRFSRTGMKGWTISLRIAAGFGSLLVVLSALALLSFGSFETAARGFSQYRASARQTVYVNEMEAAFLRMRVAAKEVIATRSAQALKDYGVRKSEFLEHAKVIRGEMDGDEIEALDRAIGLLQKHANYTAEIGASPLGDPHADEITTSAVEVGRGVDQQLEALAKRQFDEQVRIAGAIMHSVRRSKAIMIWVSVAAGALGVALAVLISLSITRPLRKIAELLSAGADQTAAAACQVASSSQALAEGASEQAASLEETSASLEEMASMTKRNADSAVQAKQLSDQMRSAADVGTADMAAMKAAMQAIKASSDDISKIIKTIDEIAFHTNILALNAAVEAARAGEAGMGFAVVADEVRNLAQRSAQSARETAGKIEVAIANSENGVVISEKVAVSLGEIVHKARSVDGLVAEIANASDEQSQGVGQANQAISQLDKVTQANAAHAEETASAAEELTAQAESQKDAVLDLLRLAGGARGKRLESKRSADPVAGPTEPTERLVAGEKKNGNVIPSRVLSSDVVSGPDRA